MEFTGMMGERRNHYGINGEAFRTEGTAVPS